MELVHYLACKKEIVKWRKIFAPLNEYKIRYLAYYLFPIPYLCNTNCNHFVAFDPVCQGMCFTIQKANRLFDRFSDISNSVFVLHD